MSPLPMLTTAFRKVVLRGGSPYYYGRKYLEMARTPHEFVARRRLAAQHHARATPADVSLVRELRERGFVVLDRRLDLTDELVSECTRRLHGHLSETPVSSNVASLTSKFFWKTLLSDTDLTSDSVFVRYALQERLVRCAAMYLGEAPYLSNVSLQYSFEVKGTTPTHSQLWHKDFDDTRMFKVFVYCSDVLDEDDGPFNVADRNAVRGMRSLPLFATFRYDDARFFAIADRSMTRPILGAAGTTFVCDTQKSFHCGSRCHRPRLACWFTYQSYAGLYPVLDRPPISSCPSPFAYVLSRRIAGSTADSAR
jgi:hypothetical protein